MLSNSIMSKTEPSKASPRAVETIKVLHDTDKSDAERILLYPKASITISLDIPRSKSVFVIVKVSFVPQMMTVKLSHSITIGRESNKLWLTTVSFAAV